MRISAGPGGILTKKGASRLRRPSLDKETPIDKLYLWTRKPGIVF